MRQALLSLAVSTALSLLTACENRPAEDAPHQMANADQQSSAEGLAIVGLYALKKRRECNDHPDAHARFAMRHEDLAINRTDQSPAATHLGER
jgi:hypothetical protein